MPKKHVGSAAPAPPVFSWPDPPYYMAVLTTRLSGEDLEEYAETERCMITLAEQQPGYLGRESARTRDGRDLTLVFYADEASMTAWRNHPHHRQAQHLGRERWYASYEVRIAKVERAYRDA